MEKNQIVLLAIAVSIALVLILVGVYLFVSSNATEQTMMGPVPINSGNQLVGIILIAVAAISLVAVLLYLAYSRSPKAKVVLFEPSQTYPQKTTQLGSSEDTSREAAKTFDVFLCYKKSSGKDYADHLKAGLEEIGLHTFEDCKDIPLACDTEEGWARFRDRALAESKYFILIMTPGLELSSEVVKELGMARRQSNKTFVFFRHRSMGRRIVVNLGEEVFDIGQLEQVSFESKEELLRLAINILQKKQSR